MSPEAAGQIAELVEFAVVAGAGVYLWLIGRGTVPFPGGRVISAGTRKWIRVAGAVGFGCGVVLIGIGVVRLVELLQ